MAPHEEEDDPAVYRSGSSKTKKDGTNGTNGHAAPKDAAAMEGVEDDEDDEVDVDAEDEVDGRTRGTRRAAATRDRQTNGTKANGRTDDSIFGMSLTAAGMCLLSSLPILFMCFVSISREYD